MLHAHIYFQANQVTTHDNIYIRSSNMQDPILSKGIIATTYMHNGHVSPFFQ